MKGGDNSKVVGVDGRMVLDWILEVGWEGWIGFI
jgi:hypothetical protein